MTSKLCVSRTSVTGGPRSAVNGVTVTPNSIGCMSRPSTDNGCSKGVASSSEIMLKCPAVPRVVCKFNPSVA